MALSVVQWTTGNVGRRSVRAVVAHPDLELIGCYAWSADKVGRDVGELCGIDTIGVTATGDTGRLLALKPDCVVYNPMWPDTDRSHPRGRRQRRQHGRVHQRARVGH